MNLRSSVYATLGATVAGAVALSPAPAAACGGFFCNNNQPVNQQAERIIFAKRPDNSVTAVIQIQYQGPSEEFAWLLPVEGSPEVAVSSNAAFDRLQAASNPQYTLNTRVEGVCRDDVGRGGVFASASAERADAGASGGDEAGVTVVDSGSVGPYDYVIIALDPNAMDLVAVALDWLRDNGYEVPEMSSDVLGPYLKMGMNLLAFRLSKGNDAGAIRPVSLAFGSGLPSIPIRPTAVAAQPDMGIMVWVLGDHRAVPANYKHLELNEALINWFNPNNNYNDVVIRAANEAKGQGFVTEHSGDATDLGQVIWQDWEQQQWDSIRATTWTNREGEFLANLGNFAQLDGMRELLSLYLKPPSNVSEDDFYNCLGCYLDYSIADVPDLDPAALLAQMQTDVIEPLLDTQKLFEEAAVSTRLYTTMSAHEMTMDPIFHFNSDLGEFPNQHTADRVIECSRNVDRFEAPWRVEFESGLKVRGEGNTWPFGADDEMPANARILQVGTEGDGRVATDNLATITKRLDGHNATVPGPGSGSGGCSATPVSFHSRFGLGLMGLGLVLALLRRRRSRA